MTTYISIKTFRKPLLGASKFGWLELGLYVPRTSRSCGSTVSSYTSIAPFSHTALKYLEILNLQNQEGNKAHQARQRSNDGHNPYNFYIKNFNTSL